METKLKVKLLVWEGDIQPYEMEEILEDVRLPVKDLLEIHNVKKYHVHFSYFECNKSFTQAVKESVKEIYNENKSYKFLEVGIQYCEM